MEAEDKIILSLETEYSKLKKCMTHLFRCRIHNIQVSFKLWNLHENYIARCTRTAKVLMARKQNYLIITKSIVLLSF